MSYYEDVRAFHRQFWPETVPRAPRLAPAPLVAASVRHMREELAEVERAAAAGDLVDLLDGLVDLVYVTLGLAVRCGLPFDAAWAEVHGANLRKVAGPGRRGGVDVVKPPGWVAPDVAGVVAAARLEGQPCD